jgi:hypothetical protein
MPRRPDQRIDLHRAAEFKKVHIRASAHDRKVMRQVVDVFAARILRLRFQG